MATLGLALAETILLSNKATVALSTLGTDLIINTIKTSTTSVGTLINYISKSTAQPSVKDIIDELNKLDLEFMVAIIEQLVSEQQGKNLHESVRKALTGVNNSLLKIVDELHVIKLAIEYHETKYFNYWRSFSCDCNIETVRNHSGVLQKRYNILIDLLKIYS